MDIRVKRLKNWKILSGEEFNEAYYIKMFCSTVTIAKDRKKLDKQLKSPVQYYFGCGHDSRKKKYEDWFLSDIRDIKGVLKWDSLLGHPFSDSVLDKIKSKLALGMFTYSQARFIIRESARVLKEGGVFELTFRDFDRLLLKRKELSSRMFNRYMYGSGLYYGSQRKSLWTFNQVVDIAKEYGLYLWESADIRGMNATCTFKRNAKKLKRFSPEPKVKYDTNGNIINDGGDFPHA